MKYIAAFKDRSTVSVPGDSYYNVSVPVFSQVKIIIVLIREKEHAKAVVLKRRKQTLNKLMALSFREPNTNKPFETKCALFFV